MTASEQAKLYGAKSLARVSLAIGRSVQTLRNWHDFEPDLFRVVCVGVVNDKPAQPAMIGERDGSSVICLPGGRILKDKSEAVDYINDLLRSAQ